MAIQSVSRALRILEFVAHHEGPVSLGLLAEGCGLNPATCAHLARTLVEEDYLEQVSARGGYILGPMLDQLARMSSYRADLVRLADPLLANLASETEETVLLAVLRRQRRFILCVHEGSQVLQIKPELLYRDDAGQTATGRLLLAHLPPGELQAYLRTHGLSGANWPGVEKEVDLISILETIRTRGMARLDHPARLTQLARPVCRKGKVIAAVGLFLPTSSLAGQEGVKLQRALQKTAETISARLNLVK